MKKYVLLAAIIITGSAISQTTISILEANNVRATLTDGGYFFNDPGTSTPGYEIPYASGNHTVYSMGLWAGGLDIGGMLHGAFSTYSSGQDYFPGPIADDYMTGYYTSTFGTSIWSVSQVDIDYHIANYTSGGYVPDPSIANWPGNGDVSEGVAAQLAPYVDVNNDQVYDPMDGDYPYIQGDQAVYVILNDAAGTHTASGSDPLGMEFHFMFYQIGGSGIENNTTFLNMKIFNRSSVTYYDFKYGVFMDYDLGYYGDDYVGCDSTRNLTYVYNSVDNDPGGSGQPGYGTNPPAFGTVFLNQSMGSAMAFDNGGGNPTTATDFYNLMQAYFINGTHLVNDGGDGTGSGYETNYAFSGNPYLGTGWNEVTATQPPGDRRMIMSSDTMTLLPGQSICVDVAFIYSRTGGANNLENMNNLLTVADDIQTYYQNNLDACSSVFASAENEESLSGIVYPNPSTGTIFLDFEGQFTAQLYDLNGKLLISDQFNEFGTMNLDLENGIYLLKVSSDRGTVTKKVQIIR